MADKMPHLVISKIGDVLSSILLAALDCGYLINSPMQGLRLTLDKRARKPRPNHHAGQV